MSGEPLIGRLRPSGPVARRGLWGLVVLLLIGLAAVAVGATIAARRIEAATARRLIDTPSPAAGEAEAKAMATAFATPRIAGTLADLATHLPAGVPVAEAARGRDGMLRIALDTADPDELRGQLASDTWFDAFHERGQEERSEGRIRVTLVEDRP